MKRFQTKNLNFLLRSSFRVSQKEQTLNYIFVSFFCGREKASSSSHDVCPHAKTPPRDTTDLFRFSKKNDTKTVDRGVDGESERDDEKRYAQTFSSA